MKTITKTQDHVTVTRQVGEYQERINADGDIVFVTKFKDETTVTIRNNGAVVVTVHSKDIDRNPKDAPKGAVARLGYGKHWAGQATLDIIDAMMVEIETEIADDEKPANIEEMAINTAYANMSEEEIKAAEKNYDNLQNEGYTDGFNPYRDNLWITKN